MCLIITSETGKMPEKAVLHEALAQNPDGFGLAFAKRRSLQILKGFGTQELDQALDRRPDGAPYVLHFRLATSGKVDHDNCHPFSVTDSVCVAHNGILDIIDPTDKRHSDTWQWVQYRIRPTLRKYPNALRWPEFVPTWEKVIGKNNKLTFLDAKGRITIVNRAAGMDVDGVWYSSQRFATDPFDSWRYYYYDHGWKKGSYERELVTAHSYVDAVVHGYRKVLPYERVEFPNQVDCDYCGMSVHVVYHVDYAQALLCRECAEYWYEENELDSHMTASAGN